MKRATSEVRTRLQTLLHAIFVSKVAREGPVSSEAFGEDDWLLNMSSRVNAGEILEPAQVSRIEEIWRRETTHESGIK